MTCGPDYSIRRLPTTLPTSLDTTSLSGLYEYTSTDFGAEWSYKTYPVAGGKAVDRDLGECDCASDVSKYEYTYISWRESCVHLADNGTGRAWIVEPVCGDGSKTYPAAVTYATNRPTFMPTPVFNPNQSVSGGGGGSNDEVAGGWPTIGRVVGYVDNSHVKVSLLEFRDGKLVESVSNMITAVVPT